MNFLLNFALGIGVKMAFIGGTVTINIWFCMTINRFRSSLVSSCISELRTFGFYESSRLEACV